MREIKNRHESIRGIESRAVRTGLLTNPPRQLVTIPDDDFEWLIEQAERSIDYDNKLISIEDNKQYVSELLEQNKCYQKALELIKLKTLDIKKNKDTRPFQIYGIASEVLEDQK